MERACPVRRMGRERGTGRREGRRGRKDMASKGKGMMMITRDYDDF